jgi:hypothetical protein
MSIHIPKNMVQKEFEMANYSNSSNVLCWSTLAYTRWKSFWPIFTLFAVFFGSLKFNFYHYLLWVQKNCFLHWSLKSPFYPHHFPHSTIFHTGEWCCEENGLGKILTLHHKRQWWKLILVWPDLPLLLNNVR